jgi:glyoxylase-like metal-dependent hydrolase (beta-lactamase superfamily II)
MPGEMPGKCREEYAVTQITRAIVHRAVAAALCVVVLGALGVTGVRAAEPQSDDLQTVQVRPNFYLVVGDGENIGVQVGHDGVVVVNSGTQAGADGLIAALKKISPLPIRYVMDSSADPDVVGGNAPVAAAGVTLFTPPKGPGAEIFGRASVIERLADMAGYPTKGWPTDTYLPNEPSRTFYLNDEPIVVTHAAAADSDSFVLFRRSDVVMAGDVLDMEHFPLINVADGGSIDGEVAALNDLLQIAVPPSPLIYEYNGTYVVPSHGRVVDQWEVVDYRDMVVIVRDTIADMMKRHMTLDQIQAAEPAKAYEPRFGSTSGPWTTNMFVEAVYHSLQAAAKKR